MIKFFFTIFLPIIFIITVSFEVTAQKPPVPVINQQEQHLFHSTTNGKSYHLAVSLPPNYSATDSSQYPVLYLLDGSFSFPIAHAARTLLDMFGEIEKVIIVGIGDEWEQSYSPWISSRWTDYTPSADPASDSNPAFLNLFDLREGALLSGGGPVFLDMIQNEIIPFIDGQYKTNQDRGIAGHSFGGLFAGYCLLKASNTFSRFGIKSPSFWWNKDEIFALEQLYSQQNQDLNAKVFISVGSKEGTSMVPKMKAFTDSLHNRNYQGLKLTSHIFEDETHNSVVAASISRTIRVLYGK
ncbi:putative esterase [Indibacter alkaliphilus LW1]|uniref:Esterase n=1 Tax=Indibacter alkaliphilus (strain CCUG 57479 / KCTC 22604 / LW1) TaxID=1189612 RepID=S2E3A2_INDAL|nr:alpha/beta hydrolase-fold protein [Indibacter alkaliphilus]EOZ96613.1 putative esterase [Indibacter alkaliphilus LW1]